MTVLLWRTVNRNNSWPGKQKLLYFQETKSAHTHRYSAAAEQTEEEMRRKIIICFSQICVWKHKAFYFPGRMAKAHWSAHTSPVSYEDRELHHSSHLPLSFSEATNPSGLSHLSFPEDLAVRNDDNRATERGRKKPKTIEKRKLLPCSCATADMPLLAHVASSSAEGTLQQFPILGSAAVRDVLAFPHNFWFLVQLKVIWHPQFVLYWLNIHSQTIQHKVNAIYIKTWCCWQRQIPLKIKNCAMVYRICDNIFLFTAIDR